MGEREREGNRVREQVYSWIIEALEQASGVD